MSSVKNFPTYKTAQYFPIILYYRRRRRRRDRMPERKGQLNRTHTHKRILYYYIYMKSVVIKPFRAQTMCASIRPNLLPAERLSFSHSHQFLFEPRANFSEIFFFWRSISDRIIFIYIHRGECLSINRAN